MIRLESLHIESIALGRTAAARLGLPDALRSVRSGHELWTAALLIHEVALNPLWRVGRRRPTASVTTVLAASRRLVEAALREIDGIVGDTTRPDDTQKSAAASRRSQPCRS